MAVVPIWLFVTGRMNGWQRGAVAVWPMTSAPARVSIGMTVQEAVLALEPEPDPRGRVSLHDLLKAGPDASGSFMWNDRGGMLTVGFRKGKVTSVQEFEMPEFAAARTRQVSISLDDDNDR